ncbi:type II secretion system F family protein [Paraeggerthella hominis]|uniref:type II secretion system F family protein n=1 Tax=Paraeggerthella hominis TaxID=2897351 RepID=UPI001E5B5A09|nr:type II secretion system F family protein [Paraeggerthella hominis]
MLDVVVMGSLLMLGALLGLASYEILVRSCAPQPRGFAVPARRVRAVEPARAEGALRRCAREALSALSCGLDRLAPVARADIDVRRDRLARAGVRLEPETWRSLRVVCAVAAGLLATLAAAFAPGAHAAVRMLAFCIGVVAGWMLPALIVSSKEKSRRRDIEAALPEAMELLSVALAAGSPVEQCFREVAESLSGPISEELFIVDQEVNFLGHSREAALEHLAARCRSQDVSAFAAHVTQAITQGSSIAEGLASQAAVARETAQADVLERIRTMPTKLDIVLSMCFLPPTVALVVVPTVVSLLEFLNDTMA